jgi:hypothetical protein
VFPEIYAPFLGGEILAPAKAIQQKEPVARQDQEGLLLALRKASERRDALR